MIQITSDSGTEPRLFESSHITIGSQHQGPNHFCIDVEDVAAIHVEVIREGDGWTMVNVKGDEDTLCDGAPFQRIPLDSERSLSLGGQVLRIGPLDVPIASDSPALIDEDAPLDEPLDDALIDKLLFELSDDPDLDIPTEQQASDFGKELEALDRLLSEGDIEDFLESDDASEEEAPTVLSEAERTLGVSDALDDEAGERDAGEEQDSPPESTAEEDLDIEFTDDESDEFDTIPQPPLEELPAAGEAATEELEKEPPVAEEEEEEEEEEAVDEVSKGPLEIHDEDAEQEIFKYSEHEGAAEENEYADALARQALIQRVSMGIAAVLLVSMITSFLAFLNLRTDQARQQTVAARAMADYAMALTYAQLHYDTPPSSGWTDPGFVLSQFDSIVTPEYRRHIALNDSLNPLQTDYRISALTTEDLSSFLLLAEPRKGLRQTLVPKPVLILGSAQMQVRIVHMHDQWASLGRASHSLAHMYAEDVHSLLAQEELIRLPSLNAGDSTQGFSPPEALGLYSSDALNTIFNAPRYYRFTQDCAERVLALLDDEKASGSYVAAVKKDCERLARLNNLVLYTIGDREDAFRLHEGLKTLEAGDAFFVGHLALSDSSGYVRHADVLPGVVPVPREATPTVEAERVPERDDSNRELRVIDFTKHKIYLAALKLLEERAEALREPTQAISDLLDSHRRQAIPDFLDQHQQLVRTLQQAEKDAEKDISEGLKTIYREQVTSEGQSLEVYLRTIDALGIRELAPRAVILQANLSQSSGAAQRPVEEGLLIELASTGSLQELYEAILAVKEWLGEEENRDSDRALSVQNQLRGLTLKKVGEFVLSPKHGSELELQQASSQNLVASILNAGGVTDDQARDFYLQEFDRLVRRLRTLENDKQLEALSEQRTVLAERLETQQDDIGPIQRRELEQQLGKVEAKIEPSEDEIDLLHSQIQRIPVELSGAKDSEQRAHEMGRLGQQMLLQAQEMPPSTERTFRLREAIGLLREATETQRIFWQDILHADALLLEGPEQEMRQILGSDIGLGSQADSLVSRAISGLKSYIQDKSTLASVTQDKEFQMRLELFKETHKHQLDRIASQAQRIGEGTERFQEQLLAYVGLLEEFQRDYEQARAEGMTEQNRGYHAIQIRRLRHKLTLAKALLKRSQPVTDQLGTLAMGLANLSQVETDALSAKHKRFEGRHVQALQTAANDLPVPNLVAEQLARYAEKAFSISVRPALPSPSGSES